jgi:sulfate permease, SulP family
MLVALPSAIAFGVAMVTPLGDGFAADGALLGILGTVAIGLVASIFGGTPRLISAPCAPAAAVLAALTAELAAENGAAGSSDAAVVLLLLMLTGLVAGAIQLVFGLLGGGKLIKYIPFPVVSGYLSGVGVLIFLKQLPYFLALPHGTSLGAGLLAPGLWSQPAVITGMATIAVMIAAPRITKRVPAPILGLAGGMFAYGILAFFDPELGRLEGNELLIGPVAGASTAFSGVAARWEALPSMTLASVMRILGPALTLAVLLSIDTLKTCVIVDAVTRSRHDSNRELRGQGLGNIASALGGGMPGAGTIGATMINLSSGGQTRLSGILEGVFALLVLIAFGGIIAWIPLSALAGILIVVAFRMVDRQSFQLLKQKSTWLDFAVIATVIVTAIFGSLIMASGAGLALAIVLFVREQMRTAVVRRKYWGHQTSSRRKRLPDERAVLEEEGRKVAIYELQGSLFFGTTDKLLTEVEADLKTCRTLILDMKRVSSVDFTATHMLELIEGRLADRGARLIFADIPRSLPSGRDLHAYFDAVGIASESSRARSFSNLDDALEWTEDQILADRDLLGKGHGAPLELRELDLFKDLDDDAIAGLRAAVTERTYSEGERIFAAGDNSDELYLIRKGAVRIMLPLSGGRARHLASFGRRDFFGDMAFLDHEPRSADAVAVTKTWLYVLSRARFDAEAEAHPLLGRKVFHRIARALAHRLRQADKQIGEMEEG